MNDELVNAKASVVSKLLVIAPYSADRPNRRCGVQTGEIPRQNRSAEDNSGGLLSRVSLLVRWSPTNHLDRVSKAVITSAAFVCSGAERRPTLRTGIFELLRQGNHWRSDRTYGVGVEYRNWRIDLWNRKLPWPQPVCIERYFKFEDLQCSHWSALLYFSLPDSRSVVHLQKLLKILRLPWIRQIMTK